MPHYLSRAVVALAVATLVSGVAVGSAAVSAHAGVVASCDGLPATIVGTEERDELEGTEGPDVIAALGGADVIDAHGGDDVVCAGSGNDVVRGRVGNDRLFGELGRDALVGKDGDDLLDGGVAGDFLLGGDGADELLGGTARDYLRGDADADLMVGGASSLDLVTYLNRGDGVVVDLRRGSGADDGSAVDGPRGARDTIRGVERLVGSITDDRLYGSRAAERIFPADGRDLVVGRGGDDRVTSEDLQPDTVRCGTGRDRARFDTRLDTTLGCEIEVPVRL